jgi:hypothetical protein
MLVWRPHQALPAARITGMIPEWNQRILLRRDRDEP